MIASRLLFLFVAVIARAVHNEILYSIRIGDGAELEPILFSSCLNMDIAIVEKCLEKPVHFDGDILYPGKLELAYFAGEKPMLFDIDDTVARDNPCVEPDINPNKEGIDPSKEEYGVFNKEKKFPVVWAEELWKKEWERDEREKESSHQTENGKEVNENIEPVAMRYAEHAFFRSEKVVDDLHMSEGMIRDNGE